MLGLGIGQLKRTVVKETFASKCAYLFDTDKDFVLNNVDYTSHVSGSSNDVSVNIIFKRGATGSKMALFASEDNSFAIYLTAADEIQLEQYDTTVQKLATTTSTFTDTTNDYYLSVIYDGTTPANTKILVNEVDEALASNTLTSTIDATTNDYYLGSNGSSLYFDGEIKQFSISTDVEILSEHVTWNENLLLPNAIFSNIVALLNFDSDPTYDVYSANFAALDTINSVVSNKYYHATNTNQGLEIADNATMAALITADFTVSMLIEINTVVASFLFGKYTSAASTDRDFDISMLGNGEIRASIYGNGLKVKATGQAIAGKKMLLTVVFDQGNSKIYINGVDETTSNGISTYVTPDASPWIIGRPDVDFTGGDFNYNFIQVINKALSGAEVLEQYNSGNPISAADTSFSANLGWQTIAKNLVFDGVKYTETDSIAGQTLESRTITTTEADQQYGGMHVAVSRNLLYTDKECNGVVNTGEIIDQVIWTGQSNSQGFVAIAELQAEYSGYRNDVKIWTGSQYDILDSAMASVANPASAGKFGGQFSFCYKFADNSGRKLFLDQYHIGGTRLYEDVGDDWNTNSVGEYFDDSVAEFVLADAAKVGYNVNLVAEVWNQFESDCTVEARADAYEANLTAYINKRRLTYPNLKFVIILVHDDLVADYKATVKAAQLSVAATLSNVVTIDQDGASSGGDNTHRDAAGYEELGRLIYEELKIN